MLAVPHLVRSKVNVVNVGICIVFLYTAVPHLVKFKGNVVNVDICIVGLYKTS